MASKSAALIILLRRIIGLIFTPYATVRKISIDGSRIEVVYIWFFVFIYFAISNTIRLWINGLFGALFLFFTTILFFSFLPGQGTYRERLDRLLVTWSYTLIPTLIWFYSTLIFYFLLPPPRTISLPGQLFSIFYIAFSGSLLVWKLILVYLSIRFSLRVHVYRILYYFLVYLVFSIPLWFLLYSLGISRIPFI